MGVFGDYSVIFNEWVRNQPLSGPDIELGNIGVEFGMFYENIGSWGNWVVDNIGTGTIW